MRRTLVVLIALVPLVAVHGISWAEPITVYQAKADPGQEVSGELVVSDARGHAVLRLNADETELRYRITASRLHHVTMSHLHLAPAGQNGSVVVGLGDHREAPLERVNGLYLAGTITAADLTGPLANEPLSRLVEELDAGRVYLNIHTLEYPAGEIRGQL